MTERTAPDVPIFSERLTVVLETIFKGEAPNAGRFCGHCYSPIDPERRQCPQCGRAVAERAPVEHVPDEVLEMFRQLRHRESMVVNGLAYLGLALGVLTFIVAFYVLFTLGAGIWWFVFNIALLFVLSRLLAGLLGGVLGDEMGFRYARRKLSEDWDAYEAQREPRVD